MKNTFCGCCEGSEKLIPEQTANRPGLNALSTRIGTHETFLETMLAALTGMALPDPRTGELIRPLDALTSRETDDPAIALLDGWATLADVLTFYGERIANEGYLRTASERRSMLELAQLVGYKLRPGVAASVYLAFTLDEGARVEIPPGTRAQSMPEPGALPQPFETMEPLQARAEWNLLKPRTARPIVIDEAGWWAESPEFYFQGATLNLQANAPILFELDGREDAPAHRLRYVEKSVPEPPHHRTYVQFRDNPAGPDTGAGEGVAVSPVPSRESIREKIVRHLRPESLVSPDTQMSRDVVAMLEKTLAILDSAASTETGFLQETLTFLHAQHQLALTGGFTRLAPWIGGIITDLEPPVIVSAKRDCPPYGNREERSFFNAHLDYKSLAAPPTPQIANATRLTRSAQQTFAADGGITTRLLSAFHPRLGQHLSTALANADFCTAEPRIKTFRVKAGVFGNSAPKRISSITNGVIQGYSEWVPIVVSPDDPDSTISSATTFPPSTTTVTEAAIEPRVLNLDAVYEGILADSMVVIVIPNQAFKVRRIEAVGTVSVTGFGITGRVTQLRLDDSWFDMLGGQPTMTMRDLRGTTIYALSESLTPASAPILEPIGHVANRDVPADDGKIELGGFYDGLEAGRWIIVSGERELEGTSGIVGSERAMIAGVTHGADSRLWKDSLHTTLTLDKKLAYTYKRETVQIYANVARATHGQTSQEILGSGDGSKPNQELMLKQKPLTFLAAPTAKGAVSSLELRVNGVQWHEVDDLIDAGPEKRVFFSKIDNDDKVTLAFGDGKRGARLPTGQENVTAIYRKGIGKPGNVAMGKISLLTKKPLGVKEVVNPLAAAGGADRENRDTARRNIPLAIGALDRLVSVSDYADFARTFAGIGKAVAAPMTDGLRQIVHLTVAGAEDIPITPDSDLYKNLEQALLRFGDPCQHVQIAQRELVLLILKARVRLQPDYAWEFVQPAIKTALYQQWSFEARELGQDATLAEVMAVIASVPGVAYVDVDLHTSVSADLMEISEWGETPVLQPRIRALLARQRSGRKILPAQLVMLNPAVPDTLILEELIP